MMKFILISLLLLLNFTVKSQTVFSRTYGAFGEFNQAAAVVSTSDSGFVICGSTGGWGAINGDITLIKTDSAGIQLWAKVYGTVAEEKAVSVCLLPDGGFLVAGITSAANGDYDYLIVRTDNAGEEIWMQTYGTDNWDIAEKAVMLTDGSIIITGTTYGGETPNGGILSIHVDPAGELIWQKLLPLNDHQLAGGLTATLDNEFIVGGSAVNPVNGTEDIFVCRLNSDGDTLFTKFFSGPLQDNLTGLTGCNQWNTYLICGTRDVDTEIRQGVIYIIDEYGAVIDTTVSTAGFDISYDDINYRDFYNTVIVANTFPDNGVQRAALFQLTYTLEFICSSVFPGAEPCFGTGINQAHNGIVLAGNTELYEPGQISIFLHKVDGNCTAGPLQVGIKDRKLLIGTAFPNPADSRINFLFNSGSIKYSDDLRLIDYQGRSVNVAFEINNDGIAADVSSLASGIYYLIYRNSENGEIYNQVIEIVHPGE